MEQTILTVTQLNLLVKGKLESDPALQNVCIRGEISNYKLYPSGHHYFTMKDAESAIRCVLFKGNSFSLRFRPENGMSVLAVGKAAIYPRDGSFQFYCTRLLPDGAGDLSVAFEQLKQKLFREGLFDPAHKKPLPSYPHRIGIVTSPAGAAVHDMLRILGRRYPLSKVILFPVRVQGAEAPAEISRALDYANQNQLCDVLIVGRGGGSAEDLWAFNEEAVSRAIYRSQIPVVSAVGHEPDVVISDYTADLRAATPSNAAELVAPDQMKLRNTLRAYESSLQTAAEKRIAEARSRLSVLASSPVLRSPDSYVQERRLRLDLAGSALHRAGTALLQEKRREIVRLSASLDAMSPLKVLARGYSIATDAAGQVIRYAADVRPEDEVFVRLQDGSLQTKVLKVEGGNP